MTTSRSASFLLAVLASVPAGLEAQTVVPGPSFEDVIGLRSVASPAISPDGRHVAFTVRGRPAPGVRYSYSRSGRPPGFHSGRGPSDRTRTASTAASMTRAMCP